MIRHPRQRRQVRVRQRDHPRAAVARVPHGAERALGIARKADAQQHIPRADPQDLLKYFADAVGMDQRDIFKQQVKVKPNKISKRARGAHA